MIAVIDYGMVNLRSVEKALQKVGKEALITSDPKKILGASGVVLPGVGASGGVGTLEHFYDVFGQDTRYPHFFGNDLGSAKSQLKSIFFF